MDTRIRFRDTAHLIREMDGVYIESAATLDELQNEVDSDITPDASIRLLLSCNGDGLYETDDEGWDHTLWQLTMTRDDGQNIRVAYKTGTGILKYTVKPFDVFISVLAEAKDLREYDSFQDFAIDMGYETDSRKAYRLWLAGRRQAKRIQTFLPYGSDFIIAASEIERGA